ncbi:MAG: WD40/YVTN/BNR-like repeat-containing protein, partial [Acidobacteriota bacterium]
MSLLSKTILMVLLILSIALVPAFGALLAQGSSKEGLEESLANLRSETTTVLAVATDPANRSVLWAGTREGLWSSQDEGRSWSRVTSDLPPGVIPLSLSIGVNSELLYMGTARHGVLRSQDRGSSWEDINRGLPEGIGRFYGAFSSLALSPADDSVLLVGTELGEIFRSADRGDSWAAATGVPGPATRRTHTPLVVFASGFPETVYAIISRPVHSHLTTNTL